MKTLTVFKYSGVALFVALHLFVLAKGEDEYYWPILTYSMFSDVEHLRSFHTYSLIAIDHNDLQLNDSALLDILYPYPNIVTALNSFKRSEFRNICSFLRERLENYPSVKEFKLLWGKNYKAEVSKEMIVDAKTTCK